ncbi:MAG: OmpA family protein [Dehalococcoidia bacterium]
MSRKAPEAKAPENHERWIVSYADMVTLLWALFVVLYALSDSNPRKLTVVQQSLDRAFNVGVLDGAAGSSPIFNTGGGATPGFQEIKSRNLNDISKKLGEFASARGLDNKVQVRQDAESITISLQDNLLFASGSATLKPGSQEVLAQVGEVLRQIPNLIQVEGHTDNVPVNNADFATNWELSGARATTVLRFLSETSGIPVERLHSANFADTRPVAGNTTPEGRALNRRADIVILYPTLEELQRILAPTGGTK